MERKLTSQHRCQISGLNSKWYVTYSDGDLIGDINYQPYGWVFTMTKVADVSQGFITKAFETLERKIGHTILIDDRYVR